MMSGRLKYWFELTELTGLEVRLGPEGIAELNACRMRLSSRTLKLGASRRGLKSITHFAKHFPAGPVALCLSGKGVLSRDFAGEGTEEQLLRQVLPDAQADDFYLQDEALAAATRLRLIRRSVAQELMEELRAHGFGVMSLYLGDMAAGGPAAEAGEGLENACSAGFSTLLGGTSSGVKDAALQDGAVELRARTRVLRVMMASGLLLLAALLINFFLLSHYQQASARLAESRSRTGQQVRKFRDLESAGRKKAELLRRAGWTGGYPMAWLTAGLVALKPAPILLSELSINPPLRSRDLSVGAAAYQSAAILVSGSCERADILNDWLQALRAEPWVGECHLMSYALNKESGRAQFSISIKIKDYEG